MSPCPPTSASSHSWPSMSSSKRRCMPTPQNPVSEALGRGILAGLGLPCGIQVPLHPLSCPLDLCRWTWQWWKWVSVGLTTALTSSGKGSCLGRQMVTGSPGGPGQGHHDPFVFCRKPVVCGVSSLGIDHTSLLGDTVEKIAWQKGGIFKVTRQTQERELRGQPRPGP